MCELCDQDERLGEIHRLYNQASRLHNLGERIKSLANGAMKPHSDQASKLGEDLKTLAIDLLKEWA